MFGFRLCLQVEQVQNHVMVSSTALVNTRDARNLATLMTMVLCLTVATGNMEDYFWNHSGNSRYSLVKLV